MQTLPPYTYAVIAVLCATAVISFTAAGRQLIALRAKAAAATDKPACPEPLDPAWVRYQPHGVQLDHLARSSAAAAQFREFQDIDRMLYAVYLDETSAER